MQSDAELMEAIRDGDDAAFRVLYERYKRALYVFALRMLGETDAARDLVQDVFMTVYQKQDQLQRPESFRSWLFAIGRNGCISHLRRNRGRTALEDAPDEAVAVNTTGDQLRAAEKVRMIRRALSELKVEYREVIILREYQNLSYREIADITESTESAVKSKLFKARKALHEYLKPALAGRVQS